MWLIEAFDDRNRFFNAWTGFTEEEVRKWIPVIQALTWQYEISMRVDDQWITKEVG